MLPDLERESIYGTNAAGIQKGTYIEIFVCPSDGDKPRSGPVTSYVANGGRVGSASLQEVQNGAFRNRIYGPQAMTAGGHWIDGREYTLIYTENVDATYYDEIGWNGFDNVSDWKLDSRFINEELKDRTWNPVLLWAEKNDESEAMWQTRINTPGLDRYSVDCEEAAPRRYTSDSCGENSGKILATWARPSSYHSRGVNVAFASGRTLFLREDIEYEVYIALMTLHDKKSDSPNPDFQLEDNHYR